MHGLHILIGAALLFFGRRLFWIFVAGSGFLAGMMLATDWFGGKPDSVTMLLALGIGVVGAVLSLFLQNAVVGVAGFFAGGYVLHALALGLKHESWIAFIIGGIIGAALVIALFDWALIALSALLGATVITQNLSLREPASAVCSLGLLVVGVIVQTRQLTGSAPKPKERSS